MKTFNTPRCSLGSNYDQVTSRSVFMLRPWMLATAIVVAIILVSLLAVPVGKWALASLNTPTLTFNPYNHVVKVTEADGKVLTNSDKRFDERVKEIKKDGRYDRDFTGRLDGRP